MNWKAGTAKAVITPEAEVWLAGYGTKRVPDGKLHDLWVKVLALEDPDGNVAVLVTTDHMGIPKAMYERMVRMLNERAGLERSQVMFTFSHNHCGPRLRGDLTDYYPYEPEQAERVAEYTDSVSDVMVETAVRALANRTPSRLSVGEGKATFAVNRRENPEAKLDEILKGDMPLKGPVDHAVPVLTVHSASGDLSAILFGYACHPTTLSFTQWCGDYPGFAQIDLEKAHPGTTAMFFNTCGADQNPLPRRTVELCEKYGQMLSAAVEEALARPMTSVSGGLGTAFEFVDLAFEKVMARDELEASSQAEKEIHARWARRLLGKLDAGETFAPAYSYPVQAWKIGEQLLLIGMGGETVVDYSLRFKQEFGPQTWVLGYSNDLVAYIPSRRVWEEGGYEGGPHLDEYGHPAMRWAGDVEDRIAGAVHRVVRDVDPGRWNAAADGPG